ncbi:MAG: sulfatase [Bacteroidota bacterium]|nr:sulfatase [Bacteroidota bacterium]
MKYRKTGFLLLFFSVNLFSLYSFAQSKAARKRPNIIFILTDDQRWDAMGAMGNTLIQTPNMDKLANAGVLFRNAYVTTSICCVSRASILTGQYELQHHIDDFSTDLSPAILQNTYPALLKKAGYTTGFLGKFGVGKHPPEQLFDYWVDTEAGGKGQPDYLIRGKDGRLIHDTDTLGNAIQIFLDQYGKSNHPFCLSVSFKAPHEQDGNPPKYIIQPKYKSYYEKVSIPAPLTADPKYWSQLPDFFRTDLNFGRARWKGLFGTPELYQENVKNYYRLITGVDDVVGNMMHKLNELGIAENTIVIIMGDNGMFLGEHGMEGKWYGYEESIRVPLLIYDQRLPATVKNHKATPIALNIDIAPTILAFAGLPAPKGMQGVDLIRLVKKKLPERKDFFYQHYFLGSPNIPRVEGVVTRNMKYMNYVEYNYEELYDITKDPHETTNLVDHPDYAAKLEALRSRYRVLQKEKGLPASKWKLSKKDF